VSNNDPDELFDRLRSGDPETADHLYREFEPLLRRIVRRRLPTRVRSRFDSTDVVQSAWTSILAGLRDGRWQFRDAGHLRAFLVRVVLCRLYDRATPALAQCGREVAVVTPRRDPVGTEPGPGDRILADEAWARLLAACPPEHQTVLHGRRAGHSCDEIAARTGHHPGSVRRILRQLARRVAFDGPLPRPVP
jgi:RNA polymerase sigma-70 factor (ECF subfamily)